VIITQLPRTSRTRPTPFSPRRGWKSENTEKTKRALLFCVSLCFFGLVHPLVCYLYCFLNFPLPLPLAYPKGEGKGESRESLSYSLECLYGPLLRSSRKRKEHLIPTKTNCNVLSPNVFRDDPGKGFEKFISCMMSLGIVNVLQAVNIEHDKSNASSAPLLPLHFSGKPLLKEEDSRIEARQIVPDGRTLETPHNSPPLQKEEAIAPQRGTQPEERGQKALPEKQEKARRRKQDTRTSEPLPDQKLRREVAVQGHGTKGYEEGKPYAVLHPSPL